MRARTLASSVAVALALGAFATPASSQELAPPAESASAKEEEVKVPGAPEHLTPEPFNFSDIERYSREKCLAEGKSAQECGAKPEEAKAAHESEPTIPFIYVLANALILYAIYYYAGRKSISAGLLARRNLVAKELDEATQVKAEAQAKLEEYTSRLDKLDSELDRMKAELTAAGEKDRDRIVKEAEEKAERMRKDARFLLDQELKQLRIDLLDHTVEVAAAAAEQVLKSKVTSQDQQRINDEYLSQIAALPAPGALGAVKERKGAAS